MDKPNITTMEELKKLPIVIPLSHALQIELFHIYPNEVNKMLTTLDSRAYEPGEFYTFQELKSNHLGIIMDPNIMRLADWFKQEVNNRNIEYDGSVQNFLDNLKNLRDSSFRIIFQQKLPHIMDSISLKLGKTRLTFKMPVIVGIVKRIDHEKFHNTASNIGQLMMIVLSILKILEYKSVHRTGYSVNDFDIHILLIDDTNKIITDHSYSHSFRFFKNLAQINNFTINFMGFESFKTRDSYDDYVGNGGPIIKLQRIELSPDSQKDQVSYSRLDNPIVSKITRLEPVKLEPEEYIRIYQTPNIQTSHATKQAPANYVAKDISSEFETQKLQFKVNTGKRYSNPPTSIRNNYAQSYLTGINSYQNLNYNPKSSNQLENELKTYKQKLIEVENENIGLKSQLEMCLAAKAQCEYDINMMKEKINYLEADKIVKDREFRQLRVDYEILKSQNVNYAHDIELLKIENRELKYKIDLLIRKLY